MSCRHCPHDACRDALCELEARDAAFRRQLRAVLLLMCILVAAIINFAGPLQRVELYRTQPALSPSVSGGIASFAWVAPSAAPRIDATGAIPSALPPGYAEGWPAVAAPESPAESAPVPIAVIPPLQRAEPSVQTAATAPVPPAQRLAPPPPLVPGELRGTNLYRRVAAPQPDPIPEASPLPRAKRQTLERSDPIQMVPAPLVPAPGPSFRPVPGPSAATAVPPPLDHENWIEVTHPQNDGGLHRAMPRVNPAPLVPVEAAVEILPAGVPFERPPELLERPAEPSEEPEDIDWQTRVQAVLREAQTARYSPDGTTLKTGLSPGGLVQWAFRRLGYRSIPQSVDDQMELTGMRVEREGYRPQVGDLLFYRIGNVNHVGIYFDATQNTFLTVVPSKGGAVVTAYDHPFFRARFEFARRLAPAP